MSNILITGATGFLGSTLINEILSSSNDVIYALVRGKDTIDAENRLISILKDLSNTRGLGKEKKGRIRVCVGDITKKDLGLDKKTRNHLLDNIDSVYHTAGITDLNLPLEKVRKVNVNGTKNVLNFALLCGKKGRLKKVSHISTAYVAGTKRGVFKEDDLDVGQRFNNTYEQSKYEAEKLVREYRAEGLDIAIFRPSIILGRYADGKTIKFRMLYQPLHFFSLELFNRIPLAGNGEVPLVNVDIAAKAIFLINNLSNRKNMNYHITSPKSPALHYVLDTASEYFGFKKLAFVPRKEIDIYKEYSPVKRRMIEPYVPYLGCLIEFAMQNTLGQLRQVGFNLPEFDEKNFIRLFEYCDKRGFIKRRRKNVVVG